MTVYNIFGIVAAIAFGLALLRFIFARTPNILITFLQDFVGAFFIFSGFVKAVDPLGTSYKMKEYFEAFGAEGMRPMWEYIANYSTFFAIVMIAAELFIGLMLIIGWKPRFTIGIFWLLTLFFTFLTGYTYLSGYCITKQFMLLSALSILLFAAAAFPEKQSRRMNITFFAFGVAIVLFLVSKLTGHFFLCDFADNKMKVTDCGCFGDFIKLKPWETFYKDIILDVMILILVLNVKMIRPVFGSMFRNGVASFMALGSMIFCLYNVYSNEPVIDFRPYKIGNDIIDLRKEKRPEKREMSWQYHNKTTKQWETVTYEDVMKNRVQYDKYDTNYRKDNILDPGIPAKILNLRIETQDGIEMTDSLLENPDYSLMVVVFNMDETHTQAFARLNEIAAGCDNLHLKFYAVVHDNGKIDEFRHKYNTAYPFFVADETPLKTIIRSNPGLVLFKHGVVINKWHYRHLPTFEELNTQYFSKK